jgi:hypothetical protein
MIGMIGDEEEQNTMGPRIACVVVELCTTTCIGYSRPADVDA